MENDKPEFYPKSTKEWRRWLQKNHTIKQSVWLILYKKNSGNPSLTYAEVVEEALCFGWIDSKPNKRDEESYFLFIAPRKPKSGWSALNKIRIEKLLQQNKIAPAGLQKIETAKKDGSWFLLDKIEAMQMPVVLKKAFAKNKPALSNFNQFPPSVKKAIYQWIENAKNSTHHTKKNYGNSNTCSKKYKGQSMEAKIK